MDIFGEICWFAMFFTPVITIPLVWRYNKGNTPAMRIITGLLWAFVSSFILFVISMGILFRNGLGSA